MPGPGTAHSAGGGGHTFSPPVNPALNSCSGSATSGTTVACTMPSAPAANTVTVAGITTAFGLAISTVSDGTNSYAITPNSSSNVNDATAGSAALAWRWTSTGGGATITATVTGGTCSFCSIDVVTYPVTGAGAVVLDMDAAGNGNGATINTPTATQTAAGQLYISFAASEAGITSVNSPWTDPFGPLPFGEAYGYIVSSSGSQASNISQTSGHWDSMVGSWK